MGRINFFEELFGDKEYKMRKLSYNLYWQIRRPKGKEGIIPKKRDFIIRSFIESGSTVLDIGCGDGRLINFLEKTNKNICKGIDFSSVAVRLARRLNLNVLLATDLEKALEREEKYDYVIMSEFIEHLVDPESIMNKVSKIFKKGIIITFPNIGHLAYRLRLLTGGFPQCWKWHPGEHIRFWTKRDFIKWIEKDNNNFPSLKVDRMRSIEGTPILEKINDSLFSYNFIAKIGRKNCKRVKVSDF